MMNRDILAPWNRLARENVAVGFVDTLLRGTGQVMFRKQPNYRVTVPGWHFLQLMGVWYCWPHRPASQHGGRYGARSGPQPHPGRALRL